MKLNLPSACRRNLLIILLMLFGNHGFSQQAGNISGHVADASGNDLTGVTVNVKGKNSSTKTDNNGDF